MKISDVFQRLGKFERDKNEGSQIIIEESHLKISPYILMGIFTNQTQINRESDAELKAKNYDIKYVNGLMYKFYKFEDKFE
jgi:hypothetical protein